MQLGQHEKKNIVKSTYTSALSWSRLFKYDFFPYHSCSVSQWKTMEIF